MTASPEIVCVRSKLLSYLSVYSSRVMMVRMQMNLRGLITAAELVLLFLKYSYRLIVAFNGNIR